MATHRLVFATLSVVLLTTSLDARAAATQPAPDAVRSHEEARAPEITGARLRLFSSVVTLGAPAAAGVVAAAALWVGAGMTWTLGGTRVRMQGDHALALPPRSAWLVLMWSGAAVGVGALALLAASAGVGSAVLLSAGGA